MITCLLACVLESRMFLWRQSAGIDVLSVLSLSLWLLTVTYIFLGHIKQNVKGSQQAHLMI